MPITDLASHATTGQEIKAHWTNVDADRLAHSLTVLKLPPDYDLADFSAALTGVEAILTELEDLENVNEMAMGTRDAGRTAMRERVVQLRETVRLRMKESIYARSLPDTPHENASEEKLLNVLDDAVSVWTHVNAATGVPGFTPPLLLRNGYSLATFQTDVAGLRVAFVAVTNAEVDRRLGRNRRDERLAAFRDRMVTYREAVGVEYGADHVLTLSLPDVYPPESSGGGDPGVPAAPGVPTLTAGPSGQIIVTWGGVAGAQFFKVYRKIDGTDLDYVFAGQATGSPMNISSLPPGETVRVRITAVNANGESAPGPFAEIVVL